MEYSFNLILCFLVGISIKIYDDITDNKLNVDIYYVELLKYFLITLFSIIFYNDVVFSTLFFVMACSSLLMDKFYTSKLENSKDNNEQQDFTCFNDNLWVYSLMLSGVAIIYHIFMNLNKMGDIQLFDYKNITFFINIIINLIIVIADIYYTPEHASDNKLNARICVIILLSIFVYYMTNFSDYIYEGNYGIMLMNISVLLGSISFLTLDKFHVFDSLKNTENIVELCKLE
jgi:hypothetical protein